MRTCHFIMRKKHLTGIVLLSSLCMVMHSCSIIRGLRADGQSGPHIYSFEHHAHDTITNGTQAFQFPYAEKQAVWIDTLHFFNQAPRYHNITLQKALAGKTDTQGILIIQNDSIVYEKCFGDISTDRLATIFSISKSITSLLCGIAVDDGFIKSVDDAVTDYLPELKKKDPMWQKLTIRHLLNMQSGLDFDDTYSLRIKHLKRLNAMAKLNYGHNLRKQIRQQKFRCAPGTEYRYESMTSQILGVVIERATGIRYADYLSEKVWRPLQMESPATINIDSHKHDLAHAFGGISTTMKDLAKLGRLYLNRGMWNGKRIVSEDWIRQSTEYDNDNHGYHFCWYNTSSIGAEKPLYPGFYAHGIRGQVLYVNPHNQLIMVRIGKHDNTYASIPYLFEQLSDSFSGELPRIGEKSK